MTRPLTSVDNALRLLLTLHDGRPIRVTEAAKLLAVSRATAHRLLATLEQRQFVEQDPATRAYLVGTALVRNWLPQSKDVFALAEPQMRALARELGEATHLTVLHGITVTVVGSVASRRAARSTTFIGTTFPAHFSASGQALLADLSLEELRRRYSNAALHQTAWRRTKVIRASDDALWNTLLAELDRTRTLGFATNFRSGNRGVNAIACSLKLGTNVAPFALVIDAPRTQTGRRRLLSYAKPLLDAATHIRHRFLPAPGRAVDQ